MLGRHPIFAASDLKLVKRGSGVLRGRAVCLSNAGVEEPLVGLITGGQGRARNGQLGMQGVVFQTRRWKYSAHPLSCAVASTRRGTTTDWDHASQGGHPRKHRVATAGLVWTGQGRRSGEAGVEDGRSASGGLRTRLREVCTTLRESTA